MKYAILYKWGSAIVTDAVCTVEQLKWAADDYTSNKYPASKVLYVFNSDGTTEIFGKYGEEVQN